MLILRGHEHAVRCLSYSPDGRYLASGGEDHTVRLWDLAAGGALDRTLEHHKGIETLVFDPVRKALLTGNATGMIAEWDLTRRREKTLKEGHKDGVRCMACAADGATLSTAGWDQSVKMWETATLKQQFVLQQGSACAALAFSPDDRTLAVGNQDGTIRLYDRGTMKCTAAIEGQLPLFALAWSPDGRLLASGHADGTIRLCEGTTTQTSLHGHTWTVYSLAFTPDGRTLVSGSADGSVRLWNVQTGQDRYSYRWHTSWVTCVAVAPDGMTAAAGSADCTIVVWDLDE